MLDMIVLGPHVRAALGPDVGPSVHDGGRIDPDPDDDEGHASADADDTTPPPSRSASPFGLPRDGLSPEAGSALDRARVGVSSILGSVGAPPLTADGMGPECPEIDEAPEAYLGSVERLASSHAVLLDSTRSALAVVGTGTAVRLGLGPVSCDGYGGGGASRAERAWAARWARNGDGGDAGDTGGSSEADEGGAPSQAEAGGGARRFPALSMHRLRVAVHRSIAEAASSLLDVLDSTAPLLQEDEGCSAGWRDFGNDLRHSLDEPPVLTLSLLAGWADGLSGLLSRVLSACLSESAVACYNSQPRGPLEGAVRRSARLAEERASYLAGASGARPNAAGGTGPDAASDPASRRRAAGVAAMRNTLEAAMISLLAFDQVVGGGDVPALPGDADRAASRGDDGLDSSDGWWAHFATLLERAVDSASRFDEEFMRPDGDADGPGGGRTGADDGAAAPADAAGSREDQREVIVSDALPREAPPTTTRDGMVEARHPEDRVLVFSGSGTRAAQRRRARRGGADVRPPAAPARRAEADRADLMDDLRSRLRLMGMREEVEVVRDEGGAGGVDGPVDGGTSTAGGDAAPATSRPLFMGVSGAMLSELTGALEVHSRGGGGGVGDEIG